MSTKSIDSPPDPDETITLHLTARQVYALAQELRQPAARDLLIQCPRLFSLVITVQVALMTAAERSEVWWYLERLIEDRGRPVS